jgi:adenylate kinase
MGPQGAGKGTQAAKLGEEPGAMHIETGDLVRSEIKEYSDKGELVPDEIIVAMTKSYLEENDSWILDGFPRTGEQAKALDEALEDIGEELDKVIVLEADDDALVERLSGRRQSEATGEVYHPSSTTRRLRRAVRRTRVHSSSAKMTPRKRSGPAWRTTMSRPSR